MEMAEPVRTVCLQRYLVQAWQEMVDSNVGKRLPASVFARKMNENDEPFLRSDETNHILMYTGAFNPPHEGHMDILADGFYNSGPGLNIVSTFVFPIPDDGLQAKEDARKKTGPTPRQVMLPLKQRAELITAHLRETEALRELACKTKVWSFPELDPIPGYMRRVIELAAADGFDVEFVSLKGSDHMWYDRPIKHPAIILCNKIMFSAIRRPNKESWVGDRPRLLRGDWSPWSQISNETGDDGVTRSVWECTLNDPVGSAVRLLTDDDNAQGPETSSTRIRKIILESAPGVDVNALVHKLRDACVLSPETLVEFLSAQSCESTGV